MPNEDNIARIGPNALTRTVEALFACYDEAQVRQILGADHAHLIGADLQEMVDERRVIALVQRLADTIGVDAARDVLWRSGELTAAYLLAHRIPGPFQKLLKPLPPRPALRLLLWAIAQHAWTFAGSGEFKYQVGNRQRNETQLTVRSSLNPAAAASGFYGGTFNRLVHELIDTEASITTSVEGSLCTYLIHHS